MKGNYENPSSAKNLILTAVAGVCLFAATPTHAQTTGVSNTVPVISIVAHDASASETGDPVYSSYIVKVGRTTPSICSC